MYTHRRRVCISSIGHAIMQVKKQVYAVKRSHSCYTCGCQIIYVVIDRGIQQPIAWDKC